MKNNSILIVEDHPFQQLFLQNLLHELGINDIICAKDTESALHYLKQRDFDLVITDLLMPGLDGVQFIQALAKHRSHPALAIMSSASRRMLMGASLVARNLRVKVIGLISKPVNITALKRVLSQLNASHQPTSTPPFVVTNHEQIAEAMKSGEVQAWFQPQKALNSGRIVAAEALVRWVHPEHGTLMPNTFLPTIVAYGLEERLLWLMLERSIAAQKSWILQGYDIPVSINLPTHLLNSQDLPDRIHSFVLAQQGSPARICFELMESSQPKHISNFYAGACRLRIKGFELSQDDFGKGYSSYMNLVSTPYTELKIDSNLVQGCNANVELAQALTSIVSLGLEMGLRVVAEGVETREELDLLRKINCTQVQGFLISHAVTSDEFQKLLTHDGTESTV